MRALALLLGGVALCVAASAFVIGCGHHPKTVVVENPPPPPPPPAQVIVVQQEPPAPMVEVIPVSPGPTFVWVSGYYAWHDRYVWVHGEWRMPPHGFEHGRWVPDRWERGPHGWERHEGRWEHGPEHGDDHHDDHHDHH